MARERSTLRPDICQQPTYLITVSNNPCSRRWTIYAKSGKSTVASNTAGTGNTERRRPCVRRRRAPRRACACIYGCTMLAYWPCKHTDRFSESDFVPPRKGEIVRQASYKLPGALLDALAAVASEQRRPVVAVVRAALSRAITAHQDSVLNQEERSPMSSSTQNQLVAVERGLRDSGRVQVDLVDPAGGAAASLVPALALDRAFPVKVVLAEEGDPFTFYARGGLDGVRELGLQRMEAAECSLQAAGMNRLPPVLASEDMARGPLAFAATPLLAELGDRVLCSALQRVLTTARCRGDVSCRSWRTCRGPGTPANRGL